MSNFVVFFFFKQKTAYELRISDWSSDVCSSDLGIGPPDEGNRMFDTKTVSIEWGGKTLTLETGRVARQADGAVLATLGETVVQIGRASCRERVCQYV